MAALSVRDKSSTSAATVPEMNQQSDVSVKHLEDQLEGAARTMSSLGTLSDRQAERVAQRMDRLASQLLELSAPPPIASVHERLGTMPAAPDDFRSLAEQMGSTDGEG